MAPMVSLTSESINQSIVSKGRKNKRKSKQREDGESINKQKHVLDTNEFKGKGTFNVWPLYP